MLCSCLEAYLNPRGWWEPPASSPGHTRVPHGAAPMTPTCQSFRTRRSLYTSAQCYCLWMWHAYWTTCEGSPCFLYTSAVLSLTADTEKCCLMRTAPFRIGSLHETGPGARYTWRPRIKKYVTRDSFILKLWYVQNQDGIVLKRLNKHKRAQVRVYYHVSGHVVTVKPVVNAPP